MAYIMAADANAWAEKTKLEFVDPLDDALIKAQAAEVISKASAAYDTASWSDIATTPDLIRQIIAMRYVGYYYLKAYSDDTTSGNNYGIFLLAQADELLEGIASGIIPLPTDIIPVVPLQSLTIPLYEETEPIFTVGDIW